MKRKKHKKKLLFGMCFSFSENTKRFKRKRNELWSSTEAPPHLPLLGALRDGVLGCEVLWSENVRTKHRKNQKTTTKTTKIHRKNMEKRQNTKKRKNDSRTSWRSNFWTVDVVQRPETQSDGWSQICCFHKVLLGQTEPIFTQNRIPASTETSLPTTRKLWGCFQTWSRIEGCLLTAWIF